MDKFSILLRFYSILFLIVHIAPETTCLEEGHRDDTVVDKALGRDVVESVIRKIQKSNIFRPDHSFLIRLAYIESKFGTEDHTFRSGYNGGIWQVDEEIFNSTQTNSSTLTQLHTQIQQKFNIDWTQVKWEDLLKPLYSGLAAAIYFSTLSTPIPDKIDQQANHWIQFYQNNGTADKFISGSADLQKYTVCRGKMDLVIVLDSSGSIGVNPYKEALQFVSSLINSFTLDHTRIGMLIYSSNVQVIFPLKNQLSIRNMADLATKAGYMSSGTNTHLGIQEAAKMFANAGSINGVPQVMIVFTDGDSNDKSATILAVNQLANTRITSISVGIGNRISNAELQTIARNDKQRIFQLSGFSALKDFFFTLTEAACEVPQVFEIEKKYTDSLVKDEKRVYTNKLPNEGITININVSEGEVEAYWSKYEEVPSKAVHDGKIDGPTFIPGGKRFKRGVASDLDSSVVYISIKGVGEMNKYTLSTMIGNNTAAIDSDDEDEDDNSIFSIIFGFFGFN